MSTAALPSYYLLIFLSSLTNTEANPNINLMNDKSRVVQIWRKIRNAVSAIFVKDKVGTLAAPLPVTDISIDPNIQESFHICLIYLPQHLNTWSFWGRSPYLGLVYVPLTSLVEPFCHWVSCGTSLSSIFLVNTFGALCTWIPDIEPMWSLLLL